MKDFIDYEKLQRLSLADKDVPLYKKIIKLQEECGEVAQEFLAWDDKQNGIRTNSSKSAQGTVKAVIAVIEEVCDVINVSIDILNALEMQNPELSRYISKIFQEKLDKWESKIESNKFTQDDMTFIGESFERSIELANNDYEDFKTQKDQIGYIETMNGNINFK